LHQENKEKARAMESMKELDLDEQCDLDEQRKSTVVGPVVQESTVVGPMAQERNDESSEIQR
jgi:hypothetical protein